MPEPQPTRRLPIGAEVLTDGVHFRVWAPARRRVEVILDGPPGGTLELRPEAGGYFSGLVSGARAGARYRYRLDGDGAFPDPASRFQPEGPHGPSEVVDPSSYGWGDGNWAGVPSEGQVVYEMHIGTFTPKGTFASALQELPALADLGVTVLEVMPVADFPGRFGWGYDGVNLFAPTRLYGRPDDFRAFVNRAHALGMGVILDVVYNHLGPDGNYLRQFAPAYFTDRHHNEWGDAINFDGPDAGPVRELFASNAGYWVDEFHVDGLRLDATQQIYDRSPESILTHIGRRVREAARGRSTYVVAENEAQEARLVRLIEAGGCGLDALWNDDFHHSARVLLTGLNEAYYSGYRGSAQELLSAIKWGYLYQGQWYAWQKKRRGTPALDLRPSQFVHYLQNHDQVANSVDGRRPDALASPGAYRAMTALVLLGPQTPMLFQGQEFAASAPFLYFADHKPELAGLVREGRRKFMSQFPSAATAEAMAAMPDPEDPATFAACKIDHRERITHGSAYALHRDLLRLRREDRVLNPTSGARIDGVVLGPWALALRYFAVDGHDRLLVLNFHDDLSLDSIAEPLLAPPAAGPWRTLWSSEDPRYGGDGTAAIDVDGRGWRLPGRSAVVLAPAPP